MKCLVCKEDFENGWDHALAPMAMADGHGGSILGFKDEAHAKFGKNVADKLYHDQTCFCGGHISGRAYSQDSCAYECDDCEFLWDE